jgi:nanoRNase/pAp phosphatase (c-di-AMP/oligoRNAs hydrolase)
VESLAKALPSKSEVSVWVDGKGWVKILSNEVRQNIKSRQALQAPKGPQTSPLLSASEAAEAVPLYDGEDIERVAIVGFQNPETSQRVVEKLQSGKGKLKILQVGSRETRPSLTQKKRSVAWQDLMSVGVDTEIHLLSIQDRVRELQSFLKEAPQIAILLQDDPDPDGLAGSLALRKLLGRNAVTAPIVSFGQITRPENVAMARLLEIEVRTVGTEELEAFDRVVMVDCQPSFFKGRKLRADVILDHHPRALGSGGADAPGFEEIREDLGSISTLLTQYLRAADMEVSQRLATALLYGIKSDTLMLNREVSELDLDAFTFLYPRINNNTLRKIERPELPLNYLKCLRNGLRYLKISRGVVVLPLGKVDREEWIPQAADFAMQFEGAEWALACGIYQNKVIVSGRNCGYIQHSGDLFKQIFSPLGSAGGHRTMAKAVIDKAHWEQRFGASSLTMGRLSMIVRRLLSKELQARASVGAPTCNAGVALGSLKADESKPI